MPYPTVDLSRVQTYSLLQRASRVDVAEFITPDTPLLPYDQPELAEVGSRILAARRAGAPVIWNIGGHVVKRGLAPVLIDLMERGVITHLASNGAALIHDFEIALIGQTSEDVASSLSDGSFGMAEETGAGLNLALRIGVQQGMGFGEAAGRWIADNESFRFRRFSLAYNAYRLGIPYTVHVAIGTDIIHQHPSVDFAAIGWGSGQDFKIFTAAVTRLEGGVFCNFGSAVIGPEVFLKALSIARNLGHTVKVFTTANFDLLTLSGDYRAPLPDTHPEYYYRPRKNIVIRPPALGGRGFHITGDHLATIPHLAARLRAGLPAAAETAKIANDTGIVSPASKVTQPWAAQPAAALSQPALERLSQALEAEPSLTPWSAGLRQAVERLSFSLRYGGTLFVCTDVSGVRLHQPAELPPFAGYQLRLAQLPGGKVLSSKLRLALRQMLLSPDTYPAFGVAHTPTEIQLAQGLYSLAHSCDALLCLCPQGESDLIRNTALAAHAFGLPIVAVVQGTAAFFADQVAGVLLLSGDGEVPVPIDLIYRTITDVLAADLLIKE